MSTGRDENYGMGAGRTGQQEQGGFGAGGDYDDDTSRRSGGKNDSTMGKMMEKAGGLFKNKGMEEKGCGEETTGWK